MSQMNPAHSIHNMHFHSFPRLHDYVNCIQQSPYWEADSSSASQEITLISWNQKVHSPTHKQPSIRPYNEPDESSPQSPQHAFSQNSTSHDYVNCIQQSPYWEADSSSASQEIPRIL